MIEPLSWEFRDEQRENPFRRGSTRPLRVTLHASGLTGLSPEQTAAIELLRELSELDDIELFETQPDAANYIRIGEEPKPGEGYFDVTVLNKGQPVRYTGVPYPEQQLTTAQGLARRSDLQHPDVQAALRAVLVVGAHTALGRDLLISESDWIYDARVRYVVQRANPRRILDGLQIVGLFLRSRDSYVYRARPKSLSDRGAFDRSLFYLVLARHRTPNMWRYHSACMSLENGPASAIRRMGASILTRCKHALQARDLIGEAFYAPHDERARDDTNYHFDYLTLLLAGALDAQARITRRLYGIRSRRNVNFRQDEFLERLRDSGANQLHELLTAPRVEALLTLLFEVRNTIHEASLASHGYSTTGRGPGSIEIGDDEFGYTLWAAAESAGRAETWGLRKLQYQRGADGTVVEPVRIMPYPYAVPLVRECLDLVDRVAAATDISRLFADRPIPKLIEAPPEDGVFSAEIRSRLTLLG